MLGHKLIRFFELYLRTCPAMFFKLVVSIDDSCDITSWSLLFHIVISTALQLKLVCVTSFIVRLSQLRDLPHSKLTFVLA